MDSLNHSTLFNIAKQVPAHAATVLRSKLETIHDVFKSRKTGVPFPPFSDLVLFEVIRILFPTSDFYHCVVTPAMILISQLLARCLVTSPACAIKGLHLRLDYVYLIRRSVHVVWMVIIAHIELSMSYFKRCLMSHLIYLCQMTNVIVYIMGRGRKHLLLLFFRWRICRTLSFRVAACLLERLQAICTGSNQFPLRSLLPCLVITLICVGASTFRRSSFEEAVHPWFGRSAWEIVCLSRTTVLILFCVNDLMQLISNNAYKSYCRAKKYTSGKLKLVHLFTEVDVDDKSIVLDIVSTAFNQAITYAEMYHDQAGLHSLH